MGKWAINFLCVSVYGRSERDTGCGFLGIGCLFDCWLRQGLSLACSMNYTRLSAEGPPLAMLPSTGIISTCYHTEPFTRVLVIGLGSSYLRSEYFTE